MARKDLRVDAYIASSAGFAKPILKHLRKLMHSACPEVEETIKWQFPTFMFKGMLCSMAAFKAHCTFGFWKHALIIDHDSTTDNKLNEAMGQLGRITAISDLPSDDVLSNYVKQAVRLNEQGIRVPRTPKPLKKKNLIVPDYFRTALKKNPRALKTFENFTTSHRREYVEWLGEAKREETRAKRLATTLSWLAEGKPRNWKYMNC